MSLNPLLRDPARTLLALDFDGTLAPIVQDPTKAFIHPRAGAALFRLAEKLGQIAIVTGRPVAQVRELASFDAEQVPRGLVVFGQYGAEWWDSETGEAIEPSQPAAIAQAMTELPQALVQCGVPQARIEDKRIAVAVHTRGLDEGAAERLLPAISALAQAHGLEIEPGRQVVELRMPGSNKGHAVHELSTRLSAKCVIYAGDDLGDVPAFEALRQLRASGIETLNIAVASDGQSVVDEFADLSMPSTDAFAGWLETYADALSI
ncbi:MAG: trehalose-phosphatase [Actinomycetales bacterium]|nr:trehalose-phosphatase [Actinomycetales bacterium]